MYRVGGTHGARRSRTDTDADQQLTSHLTVDEAFSSTVNLCFGIDDDFHYRILMPLSIWDIALDEVSVIGDY